MRLPLVKRSIRRHLTPERISKYACASKLVSLVALVAPPCLEINGSSPASRLYPVQMRRARRSHRVNLLTTSSSCIHLHERRRRNLSNRRFMICALPTTSTRKPELPLVFSRPSSTHCEQHHKFSSKPGIN